MRDSLQIGRQLSLTIATPVLVYPTIDESRIGRSEMGWSVKMFNEITEEGNTSHAHKARLGEQISDSIDGKNSKRTLLTFINSQDVRYSH